MKKMIFCALVALVAMLAPASAFAQDPARYYSEKHNISVIVPDNSKVVEDSKDVIIIKTPDDEFVFTALPFNMKECDSDTMAELWAKMAIAAKLDLDNAESMEVESETMAGVYKVSPLKNGGSCVGISYTETTSFMVTIVAGEKYVGYIYASPKKLNIGIPEE